MATSIKPELVLVEGFEEAFIGVGIRRDGSNVTIYSLSVAVDILSEREGLDRDAARRVLYHRARDTGFGEASPVWVEEMTVDELRFLVVDSSVVH